MAQRFFNCVLPLISATFGNSYLVEVPGRDLVIKIFNLFSSSSLGPLQILGNAWENSSFELLLWIYGSTTTVKSHQYFPVRFEQLQKKTWASQYNLKVTQ